MLNLCYIIHDYLQAPFLLRLHVLQAVYITMHAWPYVLLNMTGQMCYGLTFTCI